MSNRTNNTLRKIALDRKAVLHTWFDYTIAIVGGIVIFVIIFFTLSSGTIKVDREIRGHTQDIYSDEILVHYLKSPLIDNPAFILALKGEGYTELKRLVKEQYTIAGLIIKISGNQSQLMESILEKESIYIMDSVLEERKWQVQVMFPEGGELVFGNVEGETKVFGTVLPSADHKLIKVQLTVQKEKDSD